MTGTAGGARGGEGWLWGSAFVLAGLIVLQAGRLGPHEARGDVVAGTGGLTALTFQSLNEDLLAVIDGRQEQLFVYRVANRSSLEMLAAYSLPRLFAEARARATGQRP